MVGEFRIQNNDSLVGIFAGRSHHFNHHTAYRQCQKLSVGKRQSDESLE
jgi:hypothetical protein